MNQDANELVKELLKGNRRAAARLMTLAETMSPEAHAAIKQLYPHTGNAHIIGVTGPPGSGKSTLVDKLIEEYRGQDKRIGIVAVDPSSPFTGGALLGDRIRMGRFATDYDVFIRSMGSRGSLGGLAWATYDVVHILDALGKDVIIVETVGAGQAEVDIIQIAETVVLLSVPGLGDDIQTIKAGIMEIGDVFVINKADTDGADRRYVELQMMLNLDRDTEGWQPPIIKAIATTGEGVKEVVNAIQDHHQYLVESGNIQQNRERRCCAQLETIVEHSFMRKLFVDPDERALFQKLVKEVNERHIDPYTAAERLILHLIEPKKG
ncbi:MAG: methylmalonyl Co-A mutase-associated GTPase MeaB [Candidatus Thorarchaeota archaeon]